MSPLEIEVKFYLQNPEKIISRIRMSEALPRGKTHEYNACFDDGKFSLKNAGALLRLRKTEKENKLTYKGPPPEASSDFKIFSEQEVSVENFETMAAILKSIGFYPKQAYEKIRETWLMEDGTILCLDSMPFGSFLEIEGQPGGIKNCAQILGLDWEKRILTNYLAIFARIKEVFNLGFSDVTFDNFKGNKKDFSSVITEFECGSSNRAPGIDG
jgi:adenylate cyclase class 2